MQIGLNKVVGVTYKLHSNKQGAEKAFVEEADTNNPLVFLFGVGSMIPDFEMNLNGKSLGDDFEFSVVAANAYGIFDAESVVRMPMDMFKVDGVIDMELIKIGNVLPLVDGEGNRMMAKVEGVEGDSVILDFNHPLAGHDLHFTGKVIEVREASETELAHGHVHSHGEHDHH